MAKLCDFGLTIDTAKEGAVSSVGTLEYMAPELLRLMPVDDWYLRHMKRNRVARYCAKVKIPFWNVPIRSPRFCSRSPAILATAIESVCNQW